MRMGEPDEPERPPEWTALNQVQAPDATAGQGPAEGPVQRDPGWHRAGVEIKEWRHRQHDLAARLRQGTGEGAVVERHLVAGIGHHHADHARSASTAR